jgi:predicted transcriptional regulator
MKYSITALLFLLAFAVNIAVVQGGYVVEPYSFPVGPFDSGGADASISFFELPLWIQVCWIFGLVLAFFGAIKFGPLVFGRIQNVLKNKNRAAILDYISDSPGCTITDLSNNTGINRGTVKYHLYLLLLQRKIVQEKDGNRKYLFKNGGIPPEKKQVFGYISNPTKRKILLTILHEPGISNTGIAKKIQLDKSTIYWHLCQFLHEKMVVRRWDGRKMKYEVTPEIGEILKTFSL